MKTFSVRQPWAWLIAHGFKPVENRTWDTKVRGLILIHASKSFDKQGYEWVRDNFPEIDLPLPAQFERGGIVGVADLYAVATASTSPWFFGPFGFCLREAKPLPFVPMLGRLGFFEAEHPGVAFLPDRTPPLKTEFINQTTGIL
ncbi:MAG: ASCH domain-containing protein [Isosphaeraceae bacterium]